MEICQQILEKIKEYDTIIIHRHMKPDPDALGSQVGLKALLTHHFPEKTIKAVGYNEPTLTWMAEMDTVQDSDYHGALAIICDTANTARINATNKPLSPSKSITIQMMISMVTYLGWIQVQAVPVR